MRIRRSSIRLCLIAVALLSGCAGARTIADSETSGHSVRRAELLDCPGDELADAVIRALVEHGYVNDFPIDERAEQSPPEVAETLNRLALRVDPDDADLYFNTPPRAFGSSLAWVDNPYTGNTELLLVAGFRQPYGDDEPYGYNPVGNSFALAIMECTPAGIWEPTGVAPYSQFVGSEMVSGYHVVETTTGPLYMVGLRTHEPGSSVRYDTLQVFAPPGAPNETEYPPEPLSDAVDWKASMGYLTADRLGYSGYMIGSEMLPSSRTLPIVLDDGERDDNLPSEYYLGYGLPLAPPGSRMLLSFELVTSEEYLNPYDDDTRYYLDDSYIQQYIDSSTWDSGLLPLTGDISTEVDALRNALNSGTGEYIGYGVLDTYGGVDLYDGLYNDPYDEPYDEPYDDPYDDAYGDAYVGSLYTAGIGVGSIGTTVDHGDDESDDDDDPTYQAPAHTGSGTIAPHEYGALQALSDSTLSDDLLDALSNPSDSIGDLLGSSDLGIGGLNSGLYGNEAFALGSMYESSTPSYVIQHSLTARPVARIDVNSFTTSQTLQFRGWVLLARGPQPRSCRGVTTPACHPLGEREQALLRGSELEATWFAGHFESWRLAAAAAAEWGLDEQNYLILGQAPHLRLYDDEGMLIDPSTFHPRLRTSVDVNADD